MQRKIKVTRNLQGDVTDIKQAKGKYKAKPVDNSWYWERTLERDRCLYKICDEETKADILLRYKKD
jgi:hypothetical protein